MALIDSGIYQNAPRSILREGLMGYDSAMKARGAAMEQKGLMAQQGRQAKTFQQEQEERARSMKFQQTLQQISKVADYRTPEGQNQIFQGLSQAGFGAEAMELAQKFPKQAEAPMDKWGNVTNAADPTLYNERNGETKVLGIPGKPTGPTGPTPYEIEKDLFDRRLRERQLAQAGANTTKDNELAAAKYELGKQKTEAEMARKAVDVGEVSAQADEATHLIDQMIGSEDGKTKRHSGFGGFVGAKGPSSLWGLKDKPFGGTDAAGFSALYDQVKGGAFLEAVQKMKGSGALSDTEGKAASAAISRMNAAQSEGEFISAAKEFRTAIKNRKGRTIAKAAAGTPGMTAAPASPENDPLGIR